MRVLRPSLACKQVVELVTDYIEGSLGHASRRRFKRHVAACADCTKYIEQMEMTIRITSLVALEDLIPEAREKVVALHRQLRRVSN